MEMLALLLWPIAGLGLVASLVLHVNSYLQLFPPSETATILVMLGIFAVGFPTLEIIPGNTPKHQRLAPLKIYPLWMHIVGGAVAAYVMVNFVVAGLLLDPDEPYVMVRMMTGHGLIFYGVLFALLHARVWRRVEQDPVRADVHLGKGGERAG